MLVIRTIENQKNNASANSIMPLILNLKNYLKS